MVSINYENLKCIKCNLLLSVKPVLQTSEGFICGRCPREGCRVRIYEILGKTIVFPCKNQAKGCTQRFSMNEMEQHESTCMKEVFPCPHKDCKEKLVKDSIFAHILEKHDGNIDLDLNYIDINLDEENNIFKRIRLYTKLDFVINKIVENGILKTNTSYVGPKLPYSSNTFKIKFCSLNSANKLVQEKEIMEYPGKVECILEQSILRFITEKENQIRVHFEYQISSSEGCCILCPSSPTKRCKRNHTFCESCIKDNKNCLICTDDLVEEDCQIKCPLQSTQNCECSGSLQKIITHCEIEHDYIDSPIQNCKLQVIENKLVVRLVRAENHFFRYARNFDGKYINVSVMFMGPRNEASSYVYEIKLNKDDTVVTFRGICEPYRDTDDYGNLQVPIDFLQQYIIADSFVVDFYIMHR